MISVQNHLQRLSGNKIALAAAIAIAFASCTTQKQGVLRSPSAKNGEQVSALSNEAALAQKAAEQQKIEQARIAENLKNQRSIALLLPFQLNRIAGFTPTAEDVKRSALALDFYQGFQLGLESLAAKGNKISLQVLDSQDDNLRNTNLAKSKQVTDATLIVGPVYPKEIRAFSQSLANKNVLQISPLAASLASEFAIPNLVSLTPSIRTHAELMSKYVAKQFAVGDVILIYNINDTDSKQFLDQMPSEILGYNKHVQIKVVHTLEELNQNMSMAGTNHVLCGSTNKNQIRVLLAEMDKKSSEEGYSFKLYGHPNWAKLSFEDHHQMDNYELTITTSTLIDEDDPKIQQFTRNYKSKFTVVPSEFSFKGYDAALYFGSLISKYGADYAQHLVQESYSGMNNDFSFDYFPEWGYINRAVRFLVYHNNQFDKK